MENKYLHCVRSCGAATALLVVSIIGCGHPAGEDRTLVAGTVVYRGELVKDGAMLFAPCEGTTGTSLTTRIVDGKYRVDTWGGLPAGTYRVQIAGYEQASNRSESAHRSPLGGSTGPDDAPQQYLPEKYNVKTQLKFEVAPGLGRLEHNFELTD